MHDFFFFPLLLSNWFIKHSSPSSPPVLDNRADRLFLFLTLTHSSSGWDLRSPSLTANQSESEREMEAESILPGTLSIHPDISTVLRRNHDACHLRAECNLLPVIKSFAPFSFWLLLSLNPWPREEIAMIPNSWEYLKHGISLSLSFLKAIRSGGSMEIYSPGIAYGMWETGTMCFIRQKTTSILSVKKNGER